MPALGPSFLRVLGDALVLALLVIGQSTQALLALVPANDCACEGCCRVLEETSACCAGDAEAPQGAVWTDAESACACSAPASEPAPAPACTAVASPCDSRGKARLLHDATPRASGTPAWCVAWDGAFESPPRGHSPARDALKPLLHRSGGERSAWLGCARL